jgi:nitrous oxidase accessory protein NosD
MRPFLLAAALTAAGLVAAAPVRAAGPTDNCHAFITSLPATINHSGTWCIKKNLTTAMTSGFAVSVLGADDVVIDCHGYRIVGTATSPGTRYGVSVTGSDRAVVRGCRVSGFSRGISTDGAMTVVEDNRLEGNEIGIFVQGTDDGAAYGGQTVVRRNVVVDSDYAGIQASPGVSITDNIVDGVTALPATVAHGIIVDGVPYATGTIVARNIVRNIVPDPAVWATGIRNANPNSVTRDNVVVGVPSPQSLYPIQCGQGGMAVDNQVTGWSGTIGGCIQQGNNTIP